MFQMRTSKPGAGNKFYSTKSAGGYSTCIVGKPTDKNCNVLANCVGYACGRFNEIIGSMKYPSLNCNAENFIERAKSLGLEVVDYPVMGGIMVMQKGFTLSGNDGAGHVFVVEDIYADGSIYTSESGYGGSAFWNSKRSNANGRWGHAAGYSFRGCIVNPAVGKVREGRAEKPEPTPSDKFNIGDKVVINGPLYVSSNAANPSGSVSNKVTTITRKVPGTANPYNTEGDLGWMKESSISKYNEPAPTPTPAPTPAPSTGLKVGDKVKINIKSSGYSASADGTANGGRTYKVANGWVREILRIHDGKKYPYQVGNATGTTGFFKAEDLQKI